MKRFLLLIIFTYLNLMLVAQDYKVVGMEHLPLDMSAREDVKTDDRGRQCAVFRIATQNITPEQKEGFYFASDYASYVVEKVLKNGEIWLWVSPGIKTLKIMHSIMGQWELQTTHYLSYVEPLNTYKIMIQGTAPIPEVIVVQQAPAPQKKDDEQYLMFNVTPADAQLFVDDEAWPLNEGTAQKMVKLGIHHYRVEATDYYKDEGEVVVDDPTYTKMMKVNLNPAFGFLKIDDATADLTDATIYVDRDTTAISYNVSPLLKLSSGWHMIHIKHPRYTPYNHSVTIADQQTSVLKPFAKTNFVTFDFAYSNAPQKSYGLSFGSVRKLGWFLSTASNFSFEALNASHVDDDGMLYESGTYFYPEFTGETCSTRISIMTGMLFRIYKPLCLKVGAGYGCRAKSWRTSTGRLIAAYSDCYGYGQDLDLGIDATMGIQLNLKYVTIALDAVAGFGQIHDDWKKVNTEVKIGIGYNWIKLK